MTQKNTGICRMIVFLLLCILWCDTSIMSTAASSLKQDSILTLDLKELQDNHIFCYKTLPWGTEKETAEDILDIALDTPMYISEDETQTSYILENCIDYSEYPGDLFLDFNDTLTQVGFQFYSDKVPETDEFSQQILNELLSLYGEFRSCDTLKNTITGDGETVMYHWENAVQNHESGEDISIPEVYKDSCLELQLDYNEEHELRSVLVYLFYIPSDVLKP